jgi:4-hydroxy-tetrahydrodipicolinate synthase
MNSRVRLEGIWPALVTPFAPDGRLDRQGIARLIRHVLDGGVHGVFAAGSQGEFYALSDDERVALAESVVDEVNGRVPVCVGTGAITTDQAMKCTRLVAAVGVDFVGIITPFFVKPSPDELEKHFRRIAESTDKPVLLYNNPARTGVTIPPLVVDRLRSVENIIGIKDSSGDLTLLGEYIAHSPPGFKVFVGTDTLILAALALGGHGAVSASANVAPDLVVQLYTAAASGDYELARTCQRKLSPLRRAFAMGTFPAVVKEAMEIIGIGVGLPRPPVGSLDKDKRRELALVLREMGYEPPNTHISVRMEA